MKLCVYALVLLLGCAGSAVAGEVDLGGFLETNHFVGTKHGDLFDYGNTNILQLKLDAHVNDNLAAFGRFELRNTNASAVTSSADLGDRARVEPVSLRVDSAYVDFFGFLLDDLDLRVGRQHIAWGTADGFNPTSYLAPLDLQNPLDFKSHLGVDAIQVTYYTPWDLSIIAVVAPLFTPSLLPTGVFATSLPVELPAGVEVRDIQDQVVMPPAQAKNIQTAAKLAWRVFGLDMSASYFYGRYTLPVLETVNASSFDVTQSPIQADVEARLRFPRTHAAGLDIAGSLFGARFWGEAAVFFPERVDAQLTVLGNATDPLSGQPIAPVAVVDDEPYVKAVVGIDYTFKGGFYFNVQYLHGFFNELTADALQDYVIGVLRMKAFQDALELELMGGGEVDDADHLGWIGGAEVRYLPFDGGKVTLGALMARGDEGTTFDLFRDLAQVYLRFRADF